MRQFLRRCLCNNRPISFRVVQPRWKLQHYHRLVILYLVWHEYKKREVFCSGDSSLWPWFAVLLAAIALLLITLSICCCWYCCPRLWVSFSIVYRKNILYVRCPCCPWKRRRKRLSLNEFSQDHNSLQSSISPHMVYDSSTSDQHLTGDTLPISRPSSVASSRNVDDIHLTDLTNERKDKLIPHYAIAIRRSPRVIPITIARHRKWVTNET